MANLKDESGKRYGRLIVSDRAISLSNNGAFWNCLCDCGASCIIEGTHLRDGHTKSCGCLKKESARMRATTHGYSKVSSEYSSWKHMRKRCTNPNDPKYKDYGCRGIKVCPEWGDFLTFYKDMGPKPSSKHSIDRVDNNKGYYPGNCRWATAKEQSLNRRTVASLEIRVKELESRIREMETH